MIGLVTAWMTSVPGLSQAVTGSLVAAIWQGIVLAAVAGLGLRLVPKASAAVRFAIWFGVFVVVTALPVLSLLHHAASAGPAGARGSWFTVDARWCLAIAAVWATASLVRAGTLLAAGLRVRALWKRARPVELGDFVNPAHGDTATMNGAHGLETNAWIFRFAQDDNSSFGSIGAGGRRAQICTSDEVDRPTVIGFFSPKILIPSWLLEKLTAAELEQIVVHEAGHLGRADDWMNLLQKIALVIFPLNPALAWVERRLCFERELAVDERVLKAFAGRAGAAKAYAACLATLAEYRLGRRALALALGALGRESHPDQQAGWGPRSELGRRVGRILLRGEGMEPLHTRLVLGGALLGLVVAATGFERCPQVVGFARGSEDLAGVQRWSATPGDKAAISGAAVDGRPFHAASVIYRAPDKRQMRVVTHVSHEVMAVAKEPELRRNSSGDLMERPLAQSMDQSARMVQTTAAIAGARDGSRTISDAVLGQPANGVTEWIVVTTWQGVVGTRMMFTTTRSTEAAGQGATVDRGTTAGEQSAPTVQVPRYAAVPVQGGWLVFQM
jgi:Zn-dependent protease with chaperone function